VKTIVVSDLHLGYDMCNKAAFLKFLEDVCTKLSDHDQLILIGDILDFWRANSVTVLLDNAVSAVFEKLRKLRAHVIYVVGNHDYTILNVGYRERKPFTVKKSHRFEDNGVNFFLTHGYEFEVLANLAPLTVEDYEKLCVRLCHQQDLVGGFLSALYRLPRRVYEMISRRPRQPRQPKFEKLREMVVPFRVLDITKPPEVRGKPALDRIRRFAESDEKVLFFDMDRGDHLVFGHTHEPFHVPQKKVANTGCWLYNSKGYHYVEIENGRMDLIPFP